MASLIPPKKPKKPGLMPKLAIPARPRTTDGDGGDGGANAYTGGGPSGSRLALPSLGQSNAHASSSALSLSLAIPSSGAFSSSSGYGSSDGQDEAPWETGGAATNFASTASSIYPDTVMGNTGNGPAALAEDLRRAIGGMQLEDGVGAGAEGSRQEGQGEYGSQAQPSGSSARGSAGSTPGIGAPFGVGPRSGEGESSADGEEPVLKGNLEILARLGEGASGEVKKARHKPSGLLMAKKTISTSPNPAIHRQILRELSFNRTCHSAHIVRYYGAFLEDEDTSIAICMEFCEAGSLEAIYKKVKARNGRTGEKVLGKVAECVLKGLAYLHDRKIIHRDIKPSNILVTRSGQIKLCDFGVSGELINSMAGTFTGTSYYMAPERIKGLPYTITSDVWSLGLTILEVASNRFPFPPEGDPPLGPIDLLSYVVTMKVPELQDDERAGVKWGRALKDFIERCLERDPTKRPGPNKMMSHPFVRKSETRQPQPDIARFVADVWGWPTPSDTQAAAVTPTTPIAIPIPRAAVRAPMVDADLDADGRTPAERAAAKEREAALGLVGSPSD